MPESGRVTSSSRLPTAGMSVLEDNKIKLHQRRHVRPDVESHLLAVAAPLLNPSMVKPDKSLIVADAGKHHFVPSFSQADEWRQGKKLVEGRRLQGDYYVERGKKSIRPTHNGETQEWTEQRRHNLEEAMRRSEETGELCVGFTKLRKFQTRKVGPEYDMEGYMNRKQRSGASVDVMRNGIPVAIPGDRPFKDADREPGFYAKGGIIPGSSIQLREKTSVGGKGGGLIVPKGKQGRPTLSYAEKLRLKELEYEKGGVMLLSVGGTHKGVEVPSFEARTGNWLVTPEMEKD